MPSNTSQPARAAAAAAAPVPAAAPAPTAAPAAAARGRSSLPYIYDITPAFIFNIIFAFLIY